MSCPAKELTYGDGSPRPIKDNPVCDAAGHRGTQNNNPASIRQERFRGFQLNYADFALQPCLPLPVLLFLVLILWQFAHTKSHFAISVSINSRL